MLGSAVTSLSPRRAATRRLLCVLVVVCSLLAGASPAWALGTSAVRRTLAGQMRLAGAFSGAYVRDLDTGQALLARNENVARTPASVEKLYTTSTALMRFGPDATLDTTVSGRGFLDPDGVWRGDLFLRGAGDPTLDPAAIGRLAAALDGAGIQRVDGSILGDETLFDSLRGSFRTNFAFDSEIGGVLGALTVSRGFSKDGTPAKAAAQRLAAALRDINIRVEGTTGTGATPADATPLASVPSPTMADLVRRTNVPSDNFYAETLVKDLGARFGGAGSTTAGTAVVRNQLASFGIHPRIVDGSGLSRVDRTTPRQVVRLLERMHSQEVEATFEGSLPVAGRTGTLRRRMRGTLAQDRCHAKTGTLRDVSTLAGVCDTVGGDTVAFAIMMNRTSIGRARAVQDRITATIAAYGAPGGS